jgi:hypothetical protein
MNPAAARAAEPHGNKIPEAVPIKADSVPNVKCILQLAPAVAPRPKFRLSPVVTVRFTAKIVFPAKEAIDSKGYHHSQ